MRIEQASITIDELNEATIFIPGRIKRLDDQLTKAQGRLEELKKKTLTLS